jgi:predicted MFS family arabinose efflux permease
MPALAAGVQATVRPTLQGRVNAVMDAGTSVGLVFCVPTVLFPAGAWRLAYGGFALLAAIGLLAAWLLLPAASSAPRESDGRPPLTRTQSGALVRLTLFGWAAMHLSGQLPVTGVRLLPRRPALGPVLPFVSITVGQAVSSPVAGWAIERHGYTEAFGAFAALAVLAGGYAQLYPLPARVITAQRAVAPSMNA